MIASIVGAATGVVGGIIGGQQASKARKRAQAILDRQEQRAQAMYDSAVNKDYTQTASAQNALRKAREISDEYIKRAQGQQAVSGGTEEAVAEAKNKAAEVIGNTTANIAESGDARVENARTQYANAMNGVDNARVGIQNQAAEANAQAGSAAMQAGMSLAVADMQASADGKKGLVEGLFGKK